MLKDELTSWKDRGFLLGEELQTTPVDDSDPKARLSLIVFFLQEIISKSQDGKTISEIVMLLQSLNLMVLTDLAQHLDASKRPMLFISFADSFKTKALKFLDLRARMGALTKDKPQ